MGAPKINVERHQVFRHVGIVGTAQRPCLADQSDKCCQSALAPAKCPPKKFWRRVWFDKLTDSCIIAVRHIMRAPNAIIALGLILLFAGCRPKEPVSFYLSDQKPSMGGGSIPVGPATLVVSKLQFVGPDEAQRTISIKFILSDASAIERMTTENIGKTIVMVQGTNVLSVSKVFAPVLPDAGLMFPVNTNLDFESVYRAISRLE